MHQHLIEFNQNCINLLIGKKSEPKIFLSKKLRIWFSLINITYNTTGIDQSSTNKKTKSEIFESNASRACQKTLLLIRLNFNIKCTLKYSECDEQLFQRRNKDGEKCPEEIRNAANNRHFSVGILLKKLVGRKA